MSWLQKHTLAAVLSVGMLAGFGNSATAGEIDCTSGCDFEYLAGLYFSTVQLQPGGTGYIDSFLRLQHNRAEQGMNTSFRLDGNKLSFDETTDPNYTRDITLGEIPIIEDASGNQYYEFVLDINEPAAVTQSKITLIGFQLCVSTADLQYNTAGYGCDNTALGGSSVAVYDEFGNATIPDNQVHLDFNYLGTGSGATDLFVYVPTSYFAGFSADDYLYLWSMFGRPGEFWSQDGFEEWKARSTSPTDPPEPNPIVPEPASLLLLGTGLAAMGVRFRRTTRER